MEMNSSGVQEASIVMNLKICKEACSLQRGMCLPGGSLHERVHRELHLSGTSNVFSLIFQVQDVSQNPSLDLHM
jgi:hypothetical protein